MVDSKQTSIKCETTKYAVFHTKLKKIYAPIIKNK